MGPLLRKSLMPTKSRGSSPRKANSFSLLSDDEANDSRNSRIDLFQSAYDYHFTNGNASYAKIFINVNCTTAGENL